MSQPIGPTMPTLGRIVHVEMHYGTAPAIVTAVYAEGDIGCTVFGAGEDPLPLLRVPRDEGLSNGIPRAGSWHWPSVTR